MNDEIGLDYKDLIEEMLKEKKYDLKLYQKTNKNDYNMKINI